MKIPTSVASLRTENGPGDRPDGPGDREGAVERLRKTYRDATTAKGTPLPEGEPVTRARYAEAAGHRP